MTLDKWLRGTKSIDSKEKYDIEWPTRLSLHAKGIKDNQDLWMDTKLEADGTVTGLGVWCCDVLEDGVAITWCILD